MSPSHPATPSPRSNMSRPQSADSLPPIATTLPQTLLRQLEWRAGGDWSVSAQSPECFTLSYNIRGNEPVKFTMHACSTQAEVESQCAAVIYALPEREWYFLNPVAGANE